MPMGRLSEAQLESAADLLNKAEKDVRNSAATPIDVRDFTNKFYSIFPHTLGEDLPPLLDTLERIHDKLKMVSELRETFYMKHHFGGKLILITVKTVYWATLVF
jgi:hypothetical protein